MSNNENGNLQEIAKWLKKLRFRKKFLGGVSEQSVWREFNRLNAMYEAALDAERARYDAMLEHYKKTGRDSIDGEIIYDK